jgi:hypothetical protein
MQMTSLEGLKMKKWFGIIALIFVFSIFRLEVFAVEETITKFFGVGATVEEIEQATYTVKTKGKAAGEGVVHSPESIQSGQKVSLNLNLKGEGKVHLLIQETDPKGKFLAENRSDTIQLSEEWKPYKLDAILQSETTQIDVLVVTSTKEEIEFHFQNLTIETD